MPLTRREIVVTALQILDDYGLADLSMRRIAASLQVQPGALYHHIANKQTLLAALADEIIASLPDPGGEIAERLRSWAYAFRAALLAHRDGAELVASALSSRLSQRSPVDRLAELLEPLPEADLVAATVVHFILGHTLDEQGHRQLVALGVSREETPGPEVSENRFAAGIALLIAGCGLTPG